ncbi:hypothetical protein SMICM17S_04492 [Streptomyces microflavus]
MDHSSATRIGSWRGMTTDPALRRMRRVSRARAAARTAGLGKRPPNELKCRSGIHSASKPCRSANRAASMSSS